ncbi:hypothetical protein Q8F55_005798 [Vanrija albida]|uniref:Uncharacterized protein n=1 Tax=Vanrija albida TaxID=181172 RepID=A0ABR3Q2V0_9TREE
MASVAILGVAAASLAGTLYAAFSGTGALGADTPAPGIPGARVIEKAGGHAGRRAPRAPRIDCGAEKGHDDGAGAMCCTRSSTTHPQSLL